MLHNFQTHFTGTNYWAFYLHPVLFSQFSVSKLLPISADKVRSLSETTRAEQNSIIFFLIPFDRLFY
jgi:hypothetical protein